MTKAKGQSATDTDNPTARRVNIGTRSAGPRTKKESTPAPTPGIDNAPAPCDIPTRHPATTQGNSPMPTRQITIQGHVFDVEDKYEEGHVITPTEAGALNQTRAENMRNNFASVVKAAQVEARKEQNLDTDAEVTLSDATLATLREEFVEAVAAYEFGSRGSGVRLVDPVQREARRLATDAVHNAIKAKHGKLDAVPKDEIAKLIEGYAQKEDVQALAKQNLDAAKALAVNLGV